MRKSFKYGLLGAAAAVALGSFGGSAKATPYAYADVTFNDFQVTVTDATILSGSESVTTSQNYGSGVGGNTVVNTFGSNNAGVSATAENAFGGPNTTYTIASPGPVGANATPPVVGESTLKGGFGAQAASSVGANSVFSAPGDGAYSVAETGAKPNSGLNSNASESENLFTLVTGATGGSIQVTALVQAFVEALTTKFGETASAQVSNSIVLTPCTAGSTPDHCNAGIPFTAFLPSALNFGQTSGPTTGDFTTGDPMSFTGINSGAIPLLADTEYQIAFLSSVTATTSSIPEPASLAIFATGLIGLGYAFKRRQNKQV